MWHWSNFVVERSEEGGLSSQWQQFTPRCDLLRTLAGQLNRMSGSGRMLVVPVPQQLFLESGSPKPSSSYCSESCVNWSYRNLWQAQWCMGLQGNSQAFHVQNKYDRYGEGPQLAGAMLGAFFKMIIIIITFVLRDNVIIYSQALCDPNDWCQLDMNWWG